MIFMKIHLSVYFQSENDMKAVLYEDVGKLSLVDIPKPSAGPGDVVVKVKYCGICGTDIHSYKSEGILYPNTVFGHEIVGTIEEIGQGVNGFALGDRVFVGAPGLCPEGCFSCRNGRPTICLNSFTRTIGIGPGTQGGYAEYVLAEYPNRMLIKLPDSVSFEDAVLLDVLSTAYHGYCRSSLKAGQNAVVVGTGAIGLSMIQILRIAGAKHITALNRSAAKREFALRVGADLALNPNEVPNLKQKLAELYAGIGPDVVFECAGSAQTIGIAVDICRPGGQVIIVGTTPEPLSTINGVQIGLFELEIRGSLAFSEDDIRAVVSLLEKGLIQTDGMLNKIVKLEEVPRTIDALSKTSEPIRYALAP